MQVLIIEPEKTPRVADIPDDLKTLQGIVGGQIEAVYPYADEVALICNEEGKLLGLPLNRSLEGYDIIAGTFIVCGLGEEDFASLSKDLLDKYQKKFESPEVFMRINGRVVGFPTKNLEPKEATHARRCGKQDSCPSH